MRAVLSALVISASLAAQYTGEPPLLYTSPPVQDARFSGAALGAAGPVAQIQFTPMRDGTGALVPNTFYITATIGIGTTWMPHAAVYNAQSGVITPRPADVTAIAGDGFACNVSNDLLVVVWDRNGAGPAIASRANTNQPFGNVQTIAAPVPQTYNDSSLFDKDPAFAPNGYQYAYISGNSIRYATVDITTGAVLSGETTPVAAPIAVHSQMPMRQQTGGFLDIGKTRAMAFSKNDSSADAYFRSSVADNGTLPVPLFILRDDASWKANPGHMGGEVYYAYAPGNAYGNPLKLETLSCSSAFVPATGGLATIVGWSKTRTAAPVFGSIVLGVAGLGAAGLDLSFMGVTGKLGLNPANLLILPLQVFDFGQGEIGYDLPVPAMRPTTIHYQVLSFDTANSRIYLGNTAQLDVR